MIMKLFESFCTCLGSLVAVKNLLSSLVSDTVDNASFILLRPLGLAKIYIH